MDGYMVGQELSGVIRCPAVELFPGVPPLDRGEDIFLACSQRAPKLRRGRIAGETSQLGSSNDQIPKCPGHLGLLALRRTFPSQPM